MAGGSTCTTPMALREKTRGSVAEFEPHSKARDASAASTSGFLFKDSLEKPRAEFPGHHESSKWLAITAAPNLPLAARPRVGHIGLDGAVAEWLKAAVC